MLRNALQRCRTLSKTKTKPFSVPPDAVHAARNTDETRWDTFAHFGTNSMIDVLPSFPQDFVRRYELPLRPCLIQNCHECFQTPTHLWAPGNTINHSWFRALSSITDKDHPPLVPVMVQGENEDAEKVDMQLNEWLDLVSGERQTNDNQALSKYYLKDWHLQNLLQKNLPSPNAKLYSTPNGLGFDLMNEFWQAFGTNDTDYRFVYWGPANSKTPWHDDVLYTFSWSFNVCGTKVWEFEIPGQDGRLELVQQAGEMVFVPSLWRHTVTNVQETISINHNWMTVSNLDLVWESLQAGRVAIDKQVDKNQVDKAVGTATHAELVLKKEVELEHISGGMNVSVFFFMVLWRGYELVNDTNPDWVASYELVRLHDTMSELLKDAQLRHRLKATLDNGVDEGDSVADAAMDLARDFLQSAEQRFRR